MATKNTRKPSKSRTGRRSRNCAKIVLLLLCIVAEIGIITGSVWYYAFFRPQAGPEITDVAAGFAGEFFGVDYRSITGKEGADYMSSRQEKVVASSERERLWQEQELVTRVDGEVEVQILEQKIRSAVARVIFWQHEEAKATEDKDYLVYYDLGLTRSGGSWLVDDVRLADLEELKTLRLSRGAVVEDNEDETK